MNRPHRAGRWAMFAAGSLSLVLFAVLSWVGLGARALPAAAGVLILSCVAVCVVVAVTQNRAVEEVDQAINRLVEQRRAADRARRR